MENYDMVGAKSNRRDTKRCKIFGDARLNLFNRYDLSFAAFLLNGTMPFGKKELDNMVHTKSSKLTPPGGGSASSKEKLGTSVRQISGSYMDLMGRRKSKRFKNAAESESPPDCGLSSLQLRSRRIQKKLQIETCENIIVSDDHVPSSKAEVELITGENVGERDLFKPVDDMDLGVTEEAESHGVNNIANVDISEGKEISPIRAVNELDEEKPPQFNYTVKMIYPDWCRPVAARSCGCKKRCSESGNCGCIAKNGGELPYNHVGAIVRAKPLVYECGPHCKCPPSCYTRVTQRGIKFQLEIFKTESRGWGVRSLNSIPMGSFICEYTGEVIEDKEAERLAGKDEYLFDIGKKDSFTIDAARNGNIGRFINHSCSPNLYAQNVLYDHEDTTIPHVMFFAVNNISPLEELSYDYNYTIGQVTDASGNIKKKYCLCGSKECTGRLY